MKSATMKRSTAVQTKGRGLAKMLKSQALVDVFSKSLTLRNVERRFLIRLGRYLGELSVPELHAFVVSGKFNEMFPALEDETAPVAPRRFADVKKFDYKDWARRAKVSG